MPERKDVVEITPEYLIEVGKSTFEQNLSLMPVDIILNYISAERILSHLDSQKRIAGLRPEERIAGLRPEEILGGFRVAGFRPEEILEEFKPEELQQSSIVRQALTENRQHEQQRRLLRSLRRKFDDVPDEIVTLIQETSNSEQLDIWMDQMIDAEILEDIEFSTAFQSPKLVEEDVLVSVSSTDIESENVQSSITENSNAELK